MFKSNKDEAAIKRTLKEEFKTIYRSKNVLGKGSFGEVLRIYDEATGSERALKIMKKYKLNVFEKDMVGKEIGIHENLNHPNIVQMYSSLETEHGFFMVLELMKGGELFDRIIKDTYISERKAALVVRHIAEALVYLHERNIVHRDLKPENLLLATDNDDVHLKLADFGLAAKCENERLNDCCGTIRFIAPEILLDLYYGTEVDLWSLGVITYILLSGFVPFDGDNQKEIVKSVISGKVSFRAKHWGKISTEAKHLIMRCLNKRQHKRITAKEVLEHPWIKNAELTSDEALHEIAINLRQYKAKEMLKQAVQGVKAVERMRILAQSLDHLLDSSNIADSDETLA